MPPVQLLPVNPDDPIHLEELKRQRILCGWALDLVNTWCEQIRRGDKILNWILPSPLSSETYDLPEDEIVLFTGLPGPRPDDPAFRPLGHIGLNWVDDKGDLTQANREEGIICFTTFFVLGSMQGKKVGSGAMDAIEELAKELGANTITLKTTIGRNDKNRDYFENLGIPFNEKKIVNQEWYERRGYVPYAEKPTFPWTRKSDGKEFLIDAVSMRKPLRPAPATQ